MDSERSDEDAIFVILQVAGMKKCSRFLVLKVQGTQFLLGDSWMSRTEQFWKLIRSTNLRVGV